MPNSIPTKRHPRAPGAVVTAPMSFGVWILAIAGASPGPTRSPWGSAARLWVRTTIVPAPDFRGRTKLPV